jgi:hypothetical protein
MCFSPARADGTFVKIHATQTVLSRQGKSPWILFQSIECVLYRGDPFFRRVGRPLAIPAQGIIEIGDCSLGELDFE